MEENSAQRKEIRARDVIWEVQKRARLWREALWDKLECKGPGNKGSSPCRDAEKELGGA